MDTAVCLCIRTYLATEHTYVCSRYSTYYVGLYVCAYAFEYILYIISEM